MKKWLLLFTAVLFFAANAKAQYVTIPDSNFVKFLKGKYPTCMNGNLMDTTCAGITSATILDCSNESIADLTGVGYFDALKTLDCSYNALVDLPELPSTLNILLCHNNDLRRLATLPAHLTELRCYTNQIDSLREFPSSLLELSINENLIAHLPPLPPGLTRLEGNANKFTVFPEVPSTVTYFTCSFNQLTALPALPQGLELLYCRGNQLTELPPLPTTLQELNCGYNLISHLPGLPVSLTALYCFSNQLQDLPILPPAMQVLRIDDNPGIKCLPPLKEFLGKKNDFYTGGTSIKCFPNSIKHNGFFPGIDTMPICDLFNTSGCAVSWNIHGSIFNDRNSDCLQQGDEELISVPVKINLYKEDTLIQSAYTSGGSYSFEAALSTYRIAIDTTNLAFDVCRADTTVNLQGSDSMVYNLDFALHCKPGLSLGVKSIFAEVFRPSFSANVRIAVGDKANLYGLHCAGGASGVVKVILDGPVKYISPAAGALTPSGINGDTLVWNIPDYDSVKFNSSFNIIVRTDTTARSGDDVCITVIVTGDRHDASSVADTLKQCYIVRTSFDPNDKQVYPDGNTDISTEWLTYTVRFQNTGNDTAIHIYLMDTVDINLQASTFELLAYSHQPMVQWFEPGIVRFNFPNIMLPDSNVNEPASHGYVQYRVKLKDNLPIGTEVQNTAYIYFDFNEPVVTNTTLNTITVDVETGIVKQPESRNSVNLFPNPTNNLLHIIAGGFIPQWITVYDVNGRRVAEQHYVPQINISALTSGIYFMEVKSGSEVARARFVKM